MEQVNYAMGENTSSSGTDPETNNENNLPWLERSCKKREAQVTKPEVLDAVVEEY